MTSNPFRPDFSMQTQQNAFAHNPGFFIAPEDSLGANSNGQALPDQNSSSPNSNGVLEFPQNEASSLRSSNNAFGFQQGPEMFSSYDVGFQSTSMSNPMFGYDSTNPNEYSLSNTCVSISIFTDGLVRLFVRTFEQSNDDSIVPRPLPVEDDD